MTAVETFLFFLFTINSVAFCQNSSEKFLLPKIVVPDSYELYFNTYIEKFDASNEDTFAFDGQVVITVDVVATSGQIVLHSYDDVKITGLKYSKEGSASTYNVTVGVYDTETNKQYLNISPTIKVGERGFLTLNFTAKHEDGVMGFYRSSYTDNNQQNRWLLATQFESGAARRAFPCFDEPEYKALYTITVTLDAELGNQGYHVLSNAEIDHEYISNGQRTVYFRETPHPISSYLVAIVVSDFKSTSPSTFNSSYNDENGIKIFRTWGPPPDFNGQEMQLMTQKAGPAALEVMTKLTNVGFAFSKMDQAGIPDSYFGGMENWGLVIYRKNIIFPGLDAPEPTQQHIVTITTHELAHQWFGDLVTMHWWSDTWLNEGFATFFEYHASDLIRTPDVNTIDWELITQFVTTELQSSAFIIDATNSTHPLTNDVWSVSEVDVNFDNIEYSKGGCVIRMWYHILGPEIFYSALNDYLKKNQFNKGTPELLLDSFQAKIDEMAPNLLPAPVSQVFGPYITEIGYPILSVSRHDDTTLVITQQRFTTSDRVAKVAEPAPYYIPISYSTDLELNFENTSALTFMKTGDTIIILSLSKPNFKWYIINNQETGYYRVNYDESNWLALFETLNDINEYETIHIINRAQIIDDAFALSSQRYLPISTALNILSYLKHEDHLAPWQTGSRILRFLWQMTKDDAESHKLIKHFTQSLVTPALNKLGKSSFYQRRLRKELENLILSMTNEAEAEADISTLEFFEDYLGMKIPSEKTRGIYHQMNFGDDLKSSLKEWLNKI